jgi:hypothetical protein
MDRRPDLPSLGLAAAITPKALHTQDQLITVDAQAQAGHTMRHWLW